jgi:hypothetical protein
MTINSNNITINPNNITINSNNMTINNKKFTDIYNKIVHDIESLKSFYFNRYILELEFGTLNFILGELIVSTLNLYHVIIAIKKEERDILVKSINELRIIVNKLVLLIVISFNDDDNKKDNNDDFICNNEEYNLNFFNPNKENCNTIKIISTKFKIITQHIEDIKKNNNVVIDNIKINILFNKIKNNLDTINELYFQQPLPPLTNPQQTLPPQPQPQPLSKKYNINITFKEFCLLNSKNKIKVVIKMMVNIIKNIDYKEVNFYNIALFSFLFFLCFY